MKVNKEYICNILNIKLRTLKDIENKQQLKERLSKKGYLFKGKLKEGRKVYYEIELINDEMELYSNICNKVYNTDKKDQFSIFCQIRKFLSNEAYTNENIANICNVNVNTIKTWNNKLESLEMIKKDDYFYICIDMNINKTYLTTKEHYKQYWRNKNELLDKKREYKKSLQAGKITLDYYTNLIENLSTSVLAATKQYVYKVRKYKTLEDNKLFLDTLILTVKLYGDNNILQLKEPIQAFKNKYIENEI